MEQPWRRAAGSSQKGHLLGYLLPRAGKQTGAEKRKASSRITANLSSRLVCTPRADRALDRSLTDIPDDLCARAMAISCKVVAWKCDYRPELAYRSSQRNRRGGPQFPCRGGLTLDTSYLRQGGKQQAGSERHGAESLRISSPGWQTRPVFTVFWEACMLTSPASQASRRHNYV